MATIRVCFQTCLYRPECQTTDARPCDSAKPPPVAEDPIAAEVAALRTQLAEAQRERDEAKRVIRNAHQAISTQTTAAAVALAMFNNHDNGGPSLLDELTDVRDQLRAATENVSILEGIRDRRDSDLAEARADCDRMKLVVEAAEAWRDRVAGLILGTHERLLTDAVDLYRTSESN